MSDTQFSTRQVPWMKLGKLVEHPQTAAEAAKLGGLDFHVELCETAYLHNVYLNTKYEMIPSQRAVVREDTGDFFGFVSATKYHPLQYADAFAFMDTVSPEFVAAGALRGGRQGFMVVRAPDDAQIKISADDDPHELFAVLRTSHDRTRGIEVSCMPLRNLCMNQLTLRSFTRGVEHRWSIKHTSSMHGKLAEAQKSLKNLGLYARRYEVIANKLIGMKLSTVDVTKALKIIIPAPTNPTNNVAERYDTKLQRIFNLYGTSDTVAYPGTAWGLLNAVSEYYDWERGGGTPESRFIAALQGQTHNVINRTAGLLLAGV